MSLLNENMNASLQLWCRRRMLCIKSLGAILRNRLVNPRLLIKDTHLWYIFLLFGLTGDGDLGAFGSPIGWDEYIVVSWEDHTKEN